MRGCCDGDRFVGFGDIDVLAAATGLACGAHRRVHAHARRERRAASPQTSRRFLSRVHVGRASPPSARQPDRAPQAPADGLVSAAATADPPPAKPPLAPDSPDHGALAALNPGGPSAAPGPPFIPPARADSGLIIRLPSCPPSCDGICPSVERGEPSALIASDGASIIGPIND